jgi:hypothetical protein
MLAFQVESRNGSPGNFPESIYHLLIMQKGNLSFVCVCLRETNGSYPFANANGLNGQNGLNGGAHLWNLVIGTYHFAKANVQQICEGFYSLSSTISKN